MFCGSGSFAVYSLRAIHNSEHDLFAVITQPQRPAGRGRRLRHTPIAQATHELNLPLYQWENINSAQSIAEILHMAPDVICVVDYGQFLSGKITHAPSHGSFNLHGSLLPELRGAAPINWAIIRGYSRTGVTIQSLAEKIDAGDIYNQTETDIRPDETADELRERLAQLGADLICDTMNLIASGRLVPRKQDEQQVTFAKRLKKTDSRIDFSADAVTVRNLIHGTWSWPGAKSLFHRHKGGKPVQVTIARASVELSTESLPAPGTLNSDLLVATGDGLLHIIEIKPAGKRLMNWTDFVNGYHVSGGDSFTQADLYD